MDQDARLGLLLALADDELIIGHRHSEWTGWAPHIEEDLAFSSIAQDEMAHARMLYGLARQAGLTDQDEDALALGRAPEEYRNAWLCERPNGDWGFTVARQYLYDTADSVRVADLTESSWRELAEAMEVIQLEEKYHVDHAVAWFRRLGEGPSVTARERFADGLTATIGEALEVLSLDYVLARHGPVGEMVPTGSGEIPAESADFQVPQAARRDGLWVHEGGFAGAGGRRGRHSDDFVPLWEEMTALYRAHPGARW